MKAKIYLFDLSENSTDYHLEHSRWDSPKQYILDNQEKWLNGSGCGCDRDHDHDAGIGEYWELKYSPKEKSPN